VRWSLPLLSLGLLAGCHWLFPYQQGAADKQGSDQWGTSDGAPLLDGSAPCEWCREPAPTLVNLHSVWADPGGLEVYAVGEAGVVLRRTATGWQREQHALGAPTLRSVSGAGGIIWVVGSDQTASNWINTLWRREQNGVWTDVVLPPLPAECQVIRVAAWGEGVLVGAVCVGDTKIMQWRVNEWKEVMFHSFPLSDLAISVDGVSHEEYVVGDEGNILQRVNSTAEADWKLVPSGTLNPDLLYAVVYAAGGVWCALGENHGTTPQPIAACCSHVIGTNTNGPCLTTTPPLMKARDLWGTGFNWYAVGEAGLVLTLTYIVGPEYGVQFSNPSRIAPVDLNGVSGSSSGIYVVGDGGTILHHR
jgi:hypothetical protein